jgi:nitrate reductase assembly molybdenum cofactor insertion protein NarJ
MSNTTERILNLLREELSYLTNEHENDERRLENKIEGLEEMVERVEKQRDHYKMLWEVLIEKMEEEDGRKNSEKYQNALRSGQSGKQVCSED